MDDNFLTFWVFRDRRLKLKMLCVHVDSKLLQFRILAIINDCDNISSSLAMLDMTDMCVSCFPWISVWGITVHHDIDCSIFSLSTQQSCFPLWGYLTEWLRWWTRNPLGNSRVGSNPAVVAANTFTFFSHDPHPTSQQHGVSIAVSSHIWFLSLSKEYCLLVHRTNRSILM
jgi:hypothetical protein